jgi:porphyrinogen peroxidase
MSHSQPGILSAPRAFGRSVSLQLQPGADPQAALRRLQGTWRSAGAVLGVGEPLARALGKRIDGLRTFPGLSGVGCGVPSTQCALWLFVNDGDRSAVFDRSELLCGLLRPDFVVESAVDTFVYAGGRDLTGYEDGTENPKAEAAVAAAIVQDAGALSGGSFVAVQRWVHDLQRFTAWPKDARDAAIGRERDGNAELSDAPPSAHVKRAAQESFDPPAFMLRRAMPFATGDSQGLEFIAYGSSLDAFERVLVRMLGIEDGVSDALLSFSRPVTGGYYFCPPLAGEALDLRCIGL